MKKVFSIILTIICFQKNASGQLIPNIKTKPNQSVPTEANKEKVRNKEQVKSVKTQPTTQVIKFLTDSEGDLYIDGEKRGHLLPDIPLKLALQKGEYIIKVISTLNNEDQFKSKLAILEIDSERLYEINLKEITIARIQQEKNNTEIEMKREQEKIKFHYETYIKYLKSILIGDQTWMQENLNVNRFRNGDTIAEVKSEEEWKRYCELGIPAWCYYNNDPVNGQKLGKMYNWFAISDSRNLAPEGWRIPTLNDWSTLEKNAGGEKAAYNLKYNSGWINGLPVNGNGEFRGLPGGYRGYDGKFYDLGYQATWWTSSEASQFNVFHIWISSAKNNINFYNGQKKSGFYVRCIRN